MTYPRSPDTRPVHHAKAYSRLRRAKDVFKFIRSMARQGSQRLEGTQSRFVAVTYGIPCETVKRIKARFRNELSFSSEGK